MAQLTTDEKLCPTGYWKMKKAAKKNTRKTKEGMTIMKPNGVELNGKEAVVGAYKEEFQNRLANREPEEGWEEYVMEINTKIRQWLAVDSDSSSLPWTLEELKKAANSFAADKSPGLDDLPGLVLLGQPQQLLLQWPD